MSTLMSIIRQLFTPADRKLLLAAEEARIWGWVIIREFFTSPKRKNSPGSLGEAVPELFVIP